MTVDQIWQAQVEQTFERKEIPTEAQELPNLHKYVEEKVDKMRIQKDKELEDYRREIERQRRFEKSKLLQQHNAR